MDYRLYHAANGFVADHAWLGRWAAQMETWAVPVFATLTFALWLLARPRGDRKWKLASASALAAGAMALFVNQLIGRIWQRARPYQAHHVHVWGARSHDPSFPSDHASAAFAIAFAILFYDQLAGAFFVAAALAIGVGRVVVGVHYPGDVAAGALVGLGCALLVFRARFLLAPLVRLVERITDPIVARVR